MFVVFCFISYKFGLWRASDSALWLSHACVINDVLYCVTAACRERKERKKRASFSLHLLPPRSYDSMCRWVISTNKVAKAFVLLCQMINCMHSDSLSIYLHKLTLIANCIIFNVKCDIEKEVYYQSTVMNLKVALTSFCMLYDFVIIMYRYVAPPAVETFAFVFIVDVC